MVYSVFYPFPCSLTPFLHMNQLPAAFRVVGAADYLQMKQIRRFAWMLLVVFLVVVSLVWGMTALNAPAVIACVAPIGFGAGLALPLGYFALRHVRTRAAQFLPLPANHLLFVLMPTSLGGFRPELVRVAAVESRAELNLEGAVPVAFVPLRPCHWEPFSIEWVDTERNIVYSCRLRVNVELPPGILPEQVEGWIRVSSARLEQELSACFPKALKALGILAQEMQVLDPFRDAFTAKMLELLASELKLASKGILVSLSTEMLDASFIERSTIVSLRGGH